MTKKAEKKESPTIIAVEHAFFDKHTSSESLKHLGNIFEKAAAEGKKSCLFIELNSEQINNYLELEVDFKDGFYKAVQFAKRHGWKIVPLDKKSIGKKLKWPLDSILSKDALRRRKIGYNLRERSWARKLKNLKARETDFVVMHPNHIRGFLLESGIKGRKVVWIDKPSIRTYEGPSRKRLGSKERRQLKRRKVLKRKISKPGKRPR